jgi:hypothetical protein
VPAFTTVGWVVPKREFWIMMVQGLLQLTAGAPPPDGDVGVTLPEGEEGKYEATTGDIARRQSKNPIVNHRYLVLNFTDTVSGLPAVRDIAILQIIAD